MSSYTQGPIRDLVAKEIGECFAKKGSLPSDKEMEKVLEICMLRAHQGPYYRSLDTAIDTLSERVNTAQFWPAVSFIYDSTQEGVAGPPKEKENSYYNRRNDMVDTIFSKWSDEIKAELKNIETADIDHTSYTRGYQMTNHMVSNICTALNEWHAIQLAALLEQAKAKGYTKIRDQFELADEVERRKQQFPGDRVYVIMGEQLGNFFDHIYGDKNQPWRGAHAIQHSGRWDDDLGTYESLVLARSQVITSQKNQGVFAYYRASRRWHFATGVVHKFKIQVADYPGTSRRVVKDVQSSSLF